MGGVLGLREAEGLGRSRAPAFLPADIAPEPHGGLYQTLYKRLRGFILDGVWPPGTRLPSSRTLAADLKVSRNTAILAVEQLIADGWAEARSRSGVYVAAAPAPPAAGFRALEPRSAAELPAFALNRPAADLFPAPVWKQLQSRAWAEIEPQRLAGADPAGDPGLREAIARLVCAPRGLRCHPDQILIAPTASAAIDLVAAAVLRPGEAALIEHPCRPSVRQLLAARGARLHALDEGASAGARLACVAPVMRFPGCAAMNPALRARLLAWARATNGWIVEDDRDAEFWLGGEPPAPPLAADDGERVLLVGSFNRILFPGLCVAFLVAPPALAERLRAAHAIAGGRASLAAQVTLRAFIGEGHFARHLRRRRQAYAERRAVLAGLLGRRVLEAAGPHCAIDMGQGDARGAARRLADERLGGAALAECGDALRNVLLLGLGAPVEVIRAEGPRVAACIEGAS